MKSIITLLLTIASSFATRAQFFYKDIIGTQELNQLYSVYKTNRVATVQAVGFDGDGNRNTDYSESRQFDGKKNLLLISTVNGKDRTDQYYRFNERGLVSSESDTTDAVITVMNYEYDAKNNLVAIKTLSRDADTTYVDEQHIWIYRNDKPEKMYRILAKTDTTEIKFTVENGNVVDEQPFRHGVERDKTYYYYDDNNRLTDIVRYNEKARRLLPDIMFDYTDKNQVRQKKVVVSTINVGYLIWTYVYNDQGLKTKEANFNKNKEMMGKIEYSYQFGQ